MLASRPLPQASAAGQRITLYVLRGDQGVKGPDGRGHDAVVPSSLVVKEGTPVDLEIVNYTGAPHTITSLDLGLDIQIAPGKKAGPSVTPATTTASFTPSKKGAFRWHCAMACDGGGGGWATGQGYAGPATEGYMAGFIVVL